MELPALPCDHLAQGCVTGLAREESVSSGSLVWGLPGVGATCSGPVSCICCPVSPPAHNLLQGRGSLPGTWQVLSKCWGV